MAAINQENRPFVGITALIAGLLVFSLQDVIIKLFSAEYSILQIVIVRSVVDGPTVCPKHPSTVAPEVLVSYSRSSDLPGVNSDGGKSPKRIVGPGPTLMMENMPLFEANLNPRKRTRWPGTKGGLFPSCAKFARACSLILLSLPKIRGWKRTMFL